MKVYPPCIGCGTGMVSSQTTAPEGMSRYGGEGLCNKCSPRRRRNGDHPSRINREPERSTADYRLAACVGYDPTMWDSPGTLQAHQICAGCPIREGCLDDAFREGTTEVLRGGHLFPDAWGNLRGLRRLSGDDRAIRCWLLRQRGLTYAHIGRAVGMTDRGVLSAVRKVQATPELLDAAPERAEHRRRRVS